MPLLVQKLTLDDIEYLTQILYAAFSGEAWGRIMFPTTAPTSASARASTVRGYHDMIASDPRVELTKLIDPDTEEMISFAHWKIDSHERLGSEPRGKGQPKRDWDESTDAETTEALIAAVKVVDEEKLRGRPHLHHGLLNTHPDHQRRGTSGMVGQRSIDSTDAKGLPCFLEASPGGYGIYLKHGFELIGENIGLDMSKYGGQGMYQFRCMLR